jgi:hypothetical protein
MNHVRQRYARVGLHTFRYLLRLSLGKRLRWALIRGALSCSLVLLGGCTSLMSPKQQSTVLAYPQTKGYACAVHAMIIMGGVDLRSDTQGGIASCTLHQAVALTVRVHDEEGKSRIEATGTPIPGHTVIGAFNEVEQYIAKVQECR